MKEIYKKIKNKERLNTADALLLANQADILTLGELAQTKSQSLNGKKAAFLLDRNINYTNICTARCSFCAFYRPANHKEGYVLSWKELDEKIDETLRLGGTRILMQGGFHPDHNTGFYAEMVRHIKSKHPIHVHAFSPAEIHYAAKKDNLSYHQVVTQLKEAGLGSIPGGGAEILVDRIRNRIAVGKCSADQWLGAAKAAHECGIPSTATMMLGHIETWEERFEHLEKIRTLQDQTHGFISFIPWTFQPENTPLHPKIKKNKDVKLAGAYEYLRFLAIARLFLDNFQHIQVSLLTQGIKVAQLGLHFGADDLGSALIEENVVRLAGCDQEVGTEKSKMAAIIREAGFEPFERDTFYNQIH